ncbi:MAG TPA: Mth938-like domain-containing protein [Xanthomonadales bacterium]|nr:Mth938-like domain-containing protein [Xanthomonadales bacterium]
MDLSFQAPGDHNFIRSVGDEGIRIGEHAYRQSLVVTADQLLVDWPPQSFDELEKHHLQALIQLEPELVLLGTGRKQQFPAPELVIEFYQRGIGIEIMATAPACRTFNVLVAESRQVLAALLPIR